MCSRTQAQENYATRWHIKPAFGVNIPITKMPSRGITDHLIEYENASSYAQLLAGTWFFNKRWGISFRYQDQQSKNLSRRDKKFLDKVEADYQEDYYVTSSTSARYPSTSLFGAPNRALFGLVHRYEKDNWFIYPEFSFGTASFYTDWGKAYLKKKNSNELFLLSYSSERMPHDFLTLTLSSAMGYKLSKKFFLNADVMGSWYQANLQFEKQFTDLHTNHSSSEIIHYKKQILTFGAGLGLIFVIY